MKEAPVGGYFTGLQGFGTCERAESYIQGLLWEEGYFLVSARLGDVLVETGETGNGNTMECAKESWDTADGGVGQTVGCSVECGVLYWAWA